MPPSDLATDDEALPTADHPKPHRPPPKKVTDLKCQGEIANEAVPQAETRRVASRGPVKG